MLLRMIQRLVNMLFVMRNLLFPYLLQPKKVAEAAVIQKRKGPVNGDLVYLYDLLLEVRGKEPAKVKRIAGPGDCSHSQYEESLQQGDSVRVRFQESRRGTKKICISDILPA